MIAVPTGIVSVEYVNAVEHKAKTSICNVCGKSDLAIDSNYCRFCGSKILKNAEKKEV